MSRYMENLICELQGRVKDLKLLMENTRSRISSLEIGYGDMEDILSDLEVSGTPEEIAEMKARMDSQEKEFNETEELYRDLEKQLENAENELVKAQRHF